MPDVRRGETEDDFVERCMGDDEAVAEFPDADQRLAFCHSRFRKQARERRTLASRGRS